LILGFTSFFKKIVLIVNKCIPFDLKIVNKCIPFDLKIGKLEHLKRYLKHFRGSGFTSVYSEAKLVSGFTSFFKRFANLR
jgi:hypothetical protein